MGFLDSLGRVAEGAVQASPYISQMLAQRQAKQKADIAAQLTQMRQQSQDNTASVLANTQAGVGLANIAHINAETSKLGEHKPTIMRGTGGQLFDVEDPTKPIPIGPAPAVKPVAPVVGSPEWKEAEKYKASLRPSPQDTFTPFQGTDPSTGQPVVRPFNTKKGTFGDVADVAPKPGATGANSAPMAAKVGQAGEMIKKAADILPLMEGLGVSLGQSASADIAQNGVGVGHARIPGTKGVGNLMVNQTPAYAQYQATLSPFVLAAAHALSGARINDEQVKQIRASIELAPGDLGNPQVVQQKTKNLLDLVNSITGSLPPDAMSQQEGQIDPESLAGLVKRGYRRSVGRGSPVTPGHGAPTKASPSAGPDSAPGDINLGGAPVPSAAGADPESAWAAKNPPKKGETFEQYHARYQAAPKGGDE